MRFLNSLINRHQPISKQSWKPIPASSLFLRLLSGRGDSRAVIIVLISICSGFKKDESSYRLDVSMSSSRSCLGIDYMSAVIEKTEVRAEKATSGDLMIVSAVRWRVQTLWFICETNHSRTTTIVWVESPQAGSHYSKTTAAKTISSNASYKNRLHNTLSLSHGFFRDGGKCCTYSPKHLFIYEGKLKILWRFCVFFVIFKNVFIYVLTRLFYWYLLLILCCLRKTWFDAFRYLEIIWK